MNKKKGLILMLATAATTCCAGAMSSCDGFQGCTPIKVTEELKEIYTLTVKNNNPDLGTLSWDGGNLFDGRGAYDVTEQSVSNGQAYTITQKDGDAFSLDDIKSDVHVEGYELSGWQTTDGTFYEKYDRFTLKKNDTLTAVWAKCQYNVVVRNDDETKGTFTIAGTNDDGKAVHGEEVTLTAVGKTVDGVAYEAEGWYDGDIRLSKDQSYTYTPTKGVTLTLKWRVADYKVTILHNSDHGNVLGEGDYEHGTEVKLIASPREGYQFVCWKMNGNPVSTAQKWTIPDPITADITVEAVFDSVGASIHVVSAYSENETMGTVTGGSAYVEGTSVTLVATPANSDYVFDGWYKGGVKVEGAGATYTFTATAETAGSYEAKFEEVQVTKYTVTATSEDTDKGIVLSGSGEYKENATVTLIAVARDGYQFVGWYKDGASTAISTSATYTFEATAETAGSYEAKFEEVQVVPTTYNITATSEDTNKGTVTGGNTYEAGAEVTLVATAKTGYKFVGWYVGEELKSTSATYTTYATADAAYKAKFVAVHTVTVNVDGNGIVLGANEQYEEGTNVTLYAVADAGHKFVGWYQGATFVTSEKQLVISNLTANVTYVAKFEEAPEIQTFNIIATSEDDNKGTVTGGREYNAGDSVTLTATAKTGYVFDGWYVGDDKVEGAGATYTFTATANATYVAKFKAQYTVTVSSEATAKGTVTGGGEYVEGTSVTLTATPNSGYVFDGWYVGDDKVEDAGTTYTFTATANATYVAKFKAQYTVGVSSEDTNKGTVTGNGTYVEGTSVTLTAEAKTGYRFLGWYKDGASTAISTSATYTVTAEANANYEAKFIAVYTVTVTSADTTIGSVSGSGTYDAGASVTLEVSVTNPAYKFLGWYVTGTDTLITANTSYTFNASANVAYEARFEAIPAEVEIVVESANTDQGTVTGSNTYSVGESVTAIASPKEGYAFLGWFDETDTLVSTSATYTFTATEAVTLTAKFGVTISVVYYNNDDCINGMLVDETGENTIDDGTSAVYEVGSEVYYVGIPNDSYAVVFYDTEYNKLVDEDGFLTLTVTESTTLRVMWANTEATVTATVEGESTPFATVSRAGGNKLDVSKVTPNLSEDLMPEGWYDGTTKWNVDTDVVLESVDLIVKTKTAEYAVTVTANAEEGSAQVTGDCVCGNTPCTCGGVYVYGSTVTLTATTNAGYQFSGWYNGDTLLSRDATYVYTVGASNALTAKWSKQAVIGEGGLGTITPSEPSYTIGKTGDLLFKVTGLTTISTVVIDTAQLTTSDYTFDGTILTLKKAYLDTLTLGSHDVSLTVAGETKSCNFKIHVYSLATIEAGTNGDTTATATAITYNIENASDAVFTISLGGSALEGITINGYKVDAEYLTRTDLGNGKEQITIAYEFIKQFAVRSSNVMIIATQAGDGIYTFDVQTSIVTAAFNGQRTKVQKAAGTDVEFTGLDVKGKSYAVKHVAADGTVTTLDSTAYTYDATARTLVMKATYLDTFAAGLQTFRVDVADGGSSKLGFWVAVYGDEDTHLAFPLSPYGVMNFDGERTGKTYGTNDEEDEMYSLDATNKVAEDGSGKLLQLRASSNAVSNKLLGYNLDFLTTKRYLYKAKIKIDFATGYTSGQLALRLENANTYNNALTLNVNQDGTNSMAGATDASTTYLYESGVYEIAVYMTPDVAGQTLALYALNLGKCTVSIDDIEILEVPAVVDNGTKYTFEDATAVPTGDDLKLGTGVTGSIISPTYDDLIKSSLTTNFDYVMSGTKAMKLSATATDSGTTMLSSNLCATAGTEYHIQMKMRYDSPIGTAGSIALRLGGVEVFKVAITATGERGTVTKTSTKSSYNVTDGIMMFNVYATPTAANQTLELVVSGAGAWTMSVDDIYVGEDAGFAYNGEGDDNSFSIVSENSWFQENFEDGYDSTFGATEGSNIEVVTNAISGAKSLQVTTSTAGEAAEWNTALALTNSKWAAANVTYRVMMKVRVTLPTGMTSGKLNLRGNDTHTNGLYVQINSDGSYAVLNEATGNAVYSTCLYDSATGTYTLIAYCTNTAAEQSISLATVGGGSWNLIVDDVTFTQVNITAGGGSGSGGGESTFTPFCTEDFEGTTWDTTIKAFQDGANDTANLSLTTASGEVISGSQSLKVATASAYTGGTWNTLLNLTGNAWAAANTAYKVEMKVRVTLPSGLTSGHINLRGNQVHTNGLYLTVYDDGTYTVDAGSTGYSSCSYADGVYTITAYISNPGADQMVSLATVEAGAWTIIVDDLSITEATSVGGTTNTSGGTHVEGGSAELAFSTEDFEDNTIDSTITQGDGSTIAITSTNVISGTNSLQATSTVSTTNQWVTMLNLGNSWITTGTTYKIVMKVKVATWASGVTSGSLNLRADGAHGNGLLVDINTSGACVVNAASSANSTCTYADGVYTLTAYITPSTTSDVDLKAVNMGSCVLIIDDISFTNVDFEAS